ncbi:MASE1 domain-containing protein [Streptomyces sp. H51]|uniref:MASE1 domain-containing protein n=1 Tax=Streptomyces sp. H51 TaxID=3111770 RepID=UPI002D777216|nr:MASE1 domain-containing protein [Streptomyces sp. H51]
MASVVTNQDLRRTGAYVLQTLAVAAAYFLGGRLGLLGHLAAKHAVISPVWPPTGIAVACLLVLGLRCWPGIAFGAFLVVASVAPSLQPSAIGTVFGSTAAPVVAFLLLRAVGFSADLAHLRDGLELVFLGALAAMTISATSGALLLLLTDKISAGGFWTVWLAWWVGDAMGVLIVTPILLMLRNARWPMDMSRWKEAVGTAVLIGALVPLFSYNRVSALFLVYPLLIWTALRFQPMGSMLCALYASVLATLAAMDRAGPFDNLTRAQVLMKLQAYNGSMALTALLLSTVITEQHNTRRSVAQACRELVTVLEHLTAGEPPETRQPEER